MLILGVKSQKNQVFSVKVCVCEINVVILHAFSAHYDLKQQENTPKTAGKNVLKQQEKTT